MKNLLEAKKLIKEFELQNSQYQGAGAQGVGSLLKRVFYDYATTKSKLSLQTKNAVEKYVIKNHIKELVEIFDLVADFEKENQQEVYSKILQFYSLDEILDFISTDASKAKKIKNTTFFAKLKSMVKAEDELEIYFKFLKIFPIPQNVDVAKMMSEKMVKNPSQNYQYFMYVLLGTQRGANNTGRFDLLFDKANLLKVFVNNINPLQLDGFAKSLNSTIEKAHQSNQSFTNSFEEEIELYLK